ncbi:MAG: AAA family ATPase [Cetobacterium sp.]
MSFYLKELTLKNYKKYKENTLTFNSKFNLLVGENATGKTTILDGIATALGGYLQCFNTILTKDTHGIKSRDIHVKYLISNNGIEKIENIPVEILTDFDIDGENIELKRVKKNIKQGTLLNKKENVEIYKKVKTIENYINENKDIILPIFSYHGTGRLWEQENKNSSKMENLKRVDGYKDCLNAKSNYRNFISWFEKLERHAFNIREENPVLQSVKSIIGLTLEKLTQKKVKQVIYREDDLEIHYFSDNEIQRISLLSDGYRNIIGLVSDIAYRMALLNPHLNDKITNTPGIVLIDEIDLHLHPKWQREITGLLRELFPNIQFIASSHSPFIIQSMNKKEIISLDENDILLANGTEMSIEDISENIMHVKLPQQSKRKLDMLNAANEYFDILEKLENNETNENEVEKLKEKLDELLEPYEDNMAYVAFLKRKRLLSEARLEGKV